MLLAFERAEREPDPARRQELLTFVLVGAAVTDIDGHGVMLGSKLFLHIFMLIGFRNRVVVLPQWAVAYFTFQRSVRLITSQDQLDRQ
ncbi:MAG: hypothetical protein HY657_03440 [Acidobacteria bacterium]|nr:hypothetical protein [Acidobacteriota bacterium]